METTHKTTAHAHGEASFSTKAIWRTFWILLVITCIELIIGMFIAPNFPSIKILFNVLYIFLTLIKAFYIVAEFMHLRYELRNLLMTIMVPLFLFLWFIAAFLWDGSSFRDLRNTYDPYKKEQNKSKVEKDNPGDAKRHGKME